MASRQRTIGIVAEAYSKWERRSPLTPKHVARVIREHNLRVIVQPSTLRVFPDEEYRQAGAIVSPDLSPCDCIVGVKQVPSENILPNKTYVFFSHTIKAQESNMQLLDTILQRKVRLVDHECIRDPNSGERLVAFGDYAGRAGMLEALRGLGLRLLGLGYSTPFLNVGPTYSYKSLDDAVNAAASACDDFSVNGGSKAFMPSFEQPLCVVFTGGGRVSRGAQQIFRGLPRTEMLNSIEELHTKKKDPKTIYGVVVRDVDIVRRKDDPDHFPIDRKDYLSNPQHYTAELFAKKVLPHANVVLTGAYWDSRYPRWMPNTKLVTENSSNLLVIADVSCDINGTFEGLRRSTTIDDPFYYVDFKQGMREVSNEELSGKARREADLDLKLVLGVDILPSELPRDASQHFGDCLYPFLPALCDPEQPNLILERATIAKQGSLTPQFEYIGRMRTERERSKNMAALMVAEEDASTRLVQLEGHLFDTKLINRVLDLIENKRGRFQIIQASLAQPRGGPGREERTHTTVLLKVIGSSTPTESEAPTIAERTEDLIRAIERLIRESHAEAEATFNVLNVEEANAFLAALNLSDISDKDLPAWSHEDSGATQRGSKSSTRLKHFENEIVVFGSGLVSAPAIDYLTRSNPRSLIRVVSNQDAELRLLAKRFASKQNVTFESRAVSDANMARTVLESGVTASSSIGGVLSLLPAPMHLNIARACLDVGAPLVTASYVGKMRESFEAEARSKNIPILCEMGLDPGMDHMSCVRAIEHHGGGPQNLVAFESYCGGLPAPEAANNPLGYKLTWSPRGVLTALKNSAKFRENGMLNEVPNILSAYKPFVLSGYAFPSLALESIPNRDATIYAEPYGIDLAQTKAFFRGTLRFKGFCEVLHDFQREGWLDEATDVSAIKGMTWGDVLSRGKFSPRTQAFLKPYASMAVDHNNPTSKLDALCELFKVALKLDPKDRDLVLMEHRFEFKNGDRLTSSLVLFGNDRDSAMARTVGLTAAIGVQLLLDGKHKHQGAERGGVFLPTEKWVYENALQRLETEGIKFNEILEKNR